MTTEADDTLHGLDTYDQARAQMEAGAFDKAIALFEQSAAQAPHFKTLELLGECYMKLGKFKKAVVPLAAATTLNRQFRAPLLLAETLLELGDIAEAHQCAKLAAQRNSTSRRVRELLEKCRQHQHTERQNLTAEDDG